LLTQIVAVFEPGGSCPWKFPRQRPQQIAGATTDVENGTDRYFEVPQVGGNEVRLTSGGGGCCRAGCGIAVKAIVVGLVELPLADVALRRDDSSRSILR
jgi:hypothetical protein